MRRTLFGVQYLRAAAALSVLIYHAFQARTHLVNGLALGVDLFFVISGFMMVAVTDERSRPRPFLMDRIARIVPLYWLCTLGAFVLLYGRMSRGSPIPFLYALEQPGAVPWRQLLTSLLFIPADNRMTGFPAPMLPAGWTLNLEMFFYLLFGLVLLVPGRRQIATLSALFGGLIAVGLPLGPHAMPLGVWTSPMIFEFLAGAWLGCAWRDGRSLAWTATSLAAAGLVLCGIVAAIYWPDLDPGIPHNGLRVFTVAIFVPLLAIVLRLEDRSPGIHEYRWPRLLGDASYAIYLWQFFPITILARYVPPQSFTYASGVLLAGIGGGLVVHRWLERPLARAAAALRGPARRGEEGRLRVAH